MTTLRALSESDAAAFAGFSCATWDPWDKEVEDAINGHLAAELRTGNNQALGAWDGDQLAALIAWRKYGDNWRITLLAVDRHHRGNHYAERLKRHLAFLAVGGGVDLLFSSVHRENYAMIHINKAMGAAREVDPKSIDYFLYVVKAGKIAHEWQP